MEDNPSEITEGITDVEDKASGITIELEIGFRMGPRTESVSAKPQATEGISTTEGEESKDNFTGTDAIATDSAEDSSVTTNELGNKISTGSRMD